MEFKQGKKTRRVNVRSTSAEDAVKKAREAYPHTYQWGFKCLSVDSTTDN